jgi:transcriptional regulator with XRE-family HTH domain
MAKKQQSPLVPFMSIRGLTQKEIAEYLGVTPHTVTNWVKGKTEPHLTLDQWYRFAEILGTTIDKLPRSFAPQLIDKSKESD